MAVFVRGLLDVPVKIHLVDLPISLVDVLRTDHIGGV